MLHLRPAIDEAEAHRRWHTARKGEFRRTFRTVFPEPPPHKVECVWLPAYLVTIPLQTRERLDDVICSVDALSGSFAIFQMASELESGDPAGESFPPSIDESEAERIARELLLKTILRRRARAGKPVPGATRSVEPLLWPYWVYYHRRRGGRIDIQLLDAATGDRPGHKIKLGLLEAFRAQARAQSADSEGNQRG